MDAEALADGLIEVGRGFHARGWVPATGGNFSARLGSDRVMITRSGVHKGQLQRSDFLDIDLSGGVAGTGRPSYETPLHLALYRRDPRIGCVLHTHSIANTVLSRRDASVVLRGFELQKVLPEVRDPQLDYTIPVFGNDQDIERLSREVDAHLNRSSAAAYLLAGHGLYTWGHDVAQARHRVEALEFMLECVLWEES